MISTLTHFLLGLCYLHNVIYGEGNVLNNVAWSLEVEVQFYLLAPLICRLFLLRSAGLRRLLFLCLALCSHWMAYLLNSHGVHFIELTLVNHLAFFMVGFFLVDIYLNEWQSQPILSYRWDIIGVLAMSTLLIVNVVNGSTAPLWTAREWYLGILQPSLVLLAYIGAFRGLGLSRIVQNRWLTAIGGMCYTIYLYHFLLISALGRLTMHARITRQYLPNLLLQGLLIGAGTLVICSAFYLSFEKPFMYRDWPQQLRDKIATRFERIFHRAAVLAPTLSERNEV